MGMKKGGKHFGETIILDVLEMKKDGKTNREIMEYYGLDNVKVVKNLINRHNRRSQCLDLNVTQKPKGRPRKHPITAPKEMEQKIKRLEMENKLLRDFLSETGRG